MNYVLDYLAELFEEGLAYLTINGARSAISAYHEKVEGTPVGKLPLVCSLLLTGVFNKRPPLPRYTFIWDVQKVLNYLKCLPQTENLTDKSLTLKLCMLLTLTAASRCSEIKYLNTKYMTKTDSMYIFAFSELTKSWRKGRAPPSLEFHKFEQDSPYV